MERGGARRLGTPIREQPMPHPPYSRRALHPHTFVHVHVDHVQNGYAFASLPSLPVNTPPATPELSYPKASQQPAEMMQPLQPPIQLPNSFQHRGPSSHLAPSAAAIVVTEGHGRDQRVDAECTTYVRVPPPLPVVVLSSPSVQCQRWLRRHPCRT